MDVPDYLQRRQGPLTPDQWSAIDRTVNETVSSMLVGRRFISLVGPFGPGVQAVPDDAVSEAAEAGLDLLGEAETPLVATAQRRFLPLPLLYKDFTLHWRDLEANRELRLPLDTGSAAVAATAVAQAEDRLIFEGEPSLGLAGLRTVEGRQKLDLADWGREGSAFQDVVAGARALTDAGFTGPYAVVVNPRLYAELNRVLGRAGVLELERVQKLATRGVFPSPVIPDGSALLIDTGAGNLDLAVGVDVSTAYVESTNLNHRLRVLETLALRVRRPGAICHFERRTAAA